MLAVLGCSPPFCLFLWLLLHCLSTSRAGTTSAPLILSVLPRLQGFLGRCPKMELGHMSGEPERAWGPGEALGRAVRPPPPTLSPTDQLTEFVPIFGRYPESPCCGREEQGHPPSPAGLPPLTWLTFQNS